MSRNTCTSLVSFKSIGIKCFNQMTQGKKEENKTNKYAACKRHTSNQRTRKDLKVIKYKNMLNANGNLKKSEAAIHRSDKMDTKTKCMKRAKGHYIMKRDLSTKRTQLL